MLYLKALGAIERLFGRLPRWISRGLDRLSDELCVLEDVFLPRHDEAETTSPAQTVKKVRTRKKRAIRRISAPAAQDGVSASPATAIEPRQDRSGPSTGRNKSRPSERLMLRRKLHTGGIRGIAACNAPAACPLIPEISQAK
jgi:hypothetical protein